MFEFRADAVVASLLSSDHRLLLMRIANGEKTAAAMLQHLFVQFFWFREHLLMYSVYWWERLGGTHWDRLLLPPMSSSSESVLCSARDYRAWDVWCSLTHTHTLTLTRPKKRRRSPWKRPNAVQEGGLGRDPHGIATMSSARGREA